MEPTLDLHIVVTRRDDVVYAYVPDEETPGFALGVGTGATVREAVTA